MRFPDDVILSEVIRLVESGVSVTFPVQGRSMRPFIEPSGESLVLEKISRIHKGDVVLALVDNGYYVIHRVMRVSGETVYLMGDGNLDLRERCKISDVKALATYVVNSRGKKRNLYSMRRKIAAALWFALLPVRKYLLKIWDHLPRAR